MARPKKDNADYFSHDKDMRNDPKIRALRKKFGFMGYAIWCFLLEFLTDSDDFEAEWSDLNIELMAGDFDCETDELKEIVEYCLKIELLAISESNMLYSSKLKERFEPLLQKRKRDRIRIQEHQPEAKTTESRESEAKTSNEKVIASENPQSKVKESKEKKSKQENIPPNPPKEGTGKSWKEDFSLYKKELREAYAQLMNNREYLKTQERLNPRVDIKLTLEKACVNFWATEEGWIHKKRKRSKTINWKTTLTNSISQSMNRVYKDRPNSSSMEPSKEINLPQI